MAERAKQSRRRFLLAGTGMGTGLLLAGHPVAVAATPAAKGEAPEEVSPAEDLMREHGVLNRILLKQEHQLFGEHGFENTVAHVAELEKALGIYELSQFTPQP